MKLEGYFSGIKAANDAVETLKRAGITDAAADINEHYTGNNNPGTNLPTTASSTNSLANYVLTSDSPLGDPMLGPMAAASPMVSGYGKFEEIADVNYKVIVNADDQNAEKAKQIIVKMGGDLNDPNFKIPEGLKNVSIDDLVTNMINNMDKNID
ncbi:MULTISPECIES: hypothetical protein [Clostridium]|jgi:hypothetical protein|nr:MULTISPECIES: hypothetical protein [Clostridium]AQR94970.1 hypothetical protein CLSAP_22840 [Clostridium saccharoperbutylacetonicum]NSB30813.1 hypothetical protein [Clostridium saccharoperbutylacetonicum]